MTIYEANHRYAYELGQDIGHANSKVQADLLNGLAGAFENYSEFDRDMQLHYIAMDMTTGAKKVFASLAAEVS